MAIAPSRLGQLVADHWHSDEVLVRELRAAGLVRDNVPDEALRATFRMAREEDAMLSADEREYNSPNERVRVFLAPLLSPKGITWAVPLDSLNQRDET